MAEDSGATFDSLASDEERANQEESSRKEKLLEEAHARFELAEEAEEQIRRDALDDLTFISGDQWPANIRSERERDFRPCLTINRLPQFIQQVTNDQRQNRTSLRVHPVGSGATDDTSKIIQGLVRHIEYNSNADIAYDGAFESAARGGFGYFRVLPDYVSPDSFDQDLFIKRIRNPLSVHFDPYAQEPDGSDAEWAFISEDLSPEQYKLKYPNSELANGSADWQALGNDKPAWVKADSFRVAEHFYKEYQDATIHLLATGEVVQSHELEGKQQAAAAHGIDARVVSSRETKLPVIKWCKLNATEILEETTWLGMYIPIIPVYGSEYFVNNVRVLKSVIRDSKDSQRMLNYWKSAETEAIALAPRSPFVIAEGQVEGFETIWTEANRKNHAYLPYKPVSAGGTPVPPPARQNIEPAVQAITQAALAAADDLKATTGIYEAGSGMQGNEVSGVAIQRRANQIQTANFHFTDNLTISKRHCGRILIDLIPKIFDTDRAARIIGDDGEHSIVRLNAPHKDENGEDQLYDLSAGRYDVTIDTGPSFASKRQEAASAMVEVSAAYPKLMDVAGDLFIKAQDWPGAQEIADRIKKTLPPGIADDGGQQPLPPQVQAQMQQMGTMLQHLSAELQEATKVIETKKLELEHKERIELMRQQYDVAKVEAELGSKEALAMLGHQMSEIQERLKYLNMDAPIQAPNDFDPSQADGGNYAGMGHVGGTANLTGGESPGQPVEGNP